MVEVKNLVKSYGNIKAVDNISFNVEDGEILGFLGPNGAGKSTTMNIITGYLSSTKGSVKVGGVDVLEDPKKVKSMIGYLPETPPLYQDMTVIKYLEFIFELKKVKLPKKAHINEVMKLVQIDNVSTRIIKNLSKGYRQRVGFAQALIGNPPVLILDEPTVGLDPQQIIEIRSLIKKLGKKHTIIFSSHVLSEISATCDRVVVISSGKIVADAKISELSAKIVGEEKLFIEIEGSASAISSAINQIDSVKRVSKFGTAGTATQFVVEYEPGNDIRRQIFKSMAKMDCPILTMRSDGLTLEQSFLKLVSQEQSKKGGKN